ncbi:DUF664 domain-containing protein [Epidermidibacterium keratini]|uniref:DUF664 domain-containing protein n=1 Tax=Epidermidibacterium keratini TaxID=1891644 RepID=A0A7L4YSF3_9ACTN|nr:DUF664 domain-containing protein [Epidermidibacterium keratini]QHC02020.1 DUF664 domain-containing protein [Epidermidibacterium keratini]
MEARDLLIDGIERTREAGNGALDGLTAEQANWQPGEGLNSISWLLWHMAREQDAQIATLAGTEQVWQRDDWVGRFGLDLPDDSMGYGHSPAEAARVTVDDTSLLTGYLDAATDATVAYLKTVDNDGLDEVVDRMWNPPVTRGVRLVSVIDDAAQHAGQAAYLSGMIGVRE